MSGKSIRNKVAVPSSSAVKFVALCLGKDRSGQKRYGIAALPDSEDQPARLLTKGSTLADALVDARGANQIHALNSSKDELVSIQESLPQVDTDVDFNMPAFLEVELTEGVRAEAA